MLELVIGNKRYSSWSMRPWVVLRATGAPFRERVIGLDLPDTAAEIAKVSPAGRVPVLFDGDLRVWDSLAICEYLSERFPEARLWPADRAARAEARSACAEMHAGFGALRSELTMRIYPPTLAVPKVTPSEAAKADVARITSLWAELRARHGAAGPYLFGAFTIADAFYAPVAVGRLLAYGVELDAPTRAYVDAVARHPAVAAWVADAHAETLRARRYE